MCKTKEELILEKVKILGEILEEKDKLIATLRERIAELERRADDSVHLIPDAWGTWKWTTPQVTYLNDPFPTIGYKKETPYCLTC